LNVLEANLSDMLKIELTTTYGAYVLDFNEDFLLSQADFSEIPDDELDNVMNRLPTRQMILNGSLSVSHQLLNSRELELEEVLAIARSEARRVIMDQKKLEFLNKEISKTEVTATGNEISVHTLTSGSYKQQILDLKSQILKLKEDARFLDKLMKIVDNRQMVLLHLSKKRSRVD